MEEGEIIRAIQKVKSQNSEYFDTQDDKEGLENDRKKNCFIRY